MTAVDPADLKELTRSRYGARAKTVLEEGLQSSSCCESDCCGSNPQGANPFSEGIYDLDELDGVPLRAALATLGCANPLALAELTEGETVLDLGSGGGLDVILSAKRVGVSGHAYGLDMTDEMLSLAWQNALEAGVGNVTFLKGDIETIPMPDACVDVVISNCVINLASDKDRVAREIFRVLRPGGRLAVTDVVITPEFPDTPLAAALRSDVVAWGSCLAGALTDIEYQSKLSGAGLQDIKMEIVRRHITDELFPVGLPDWARVADRVQVDQLMSHFTSTMVRAIKPAA